MEEVSLFRDIALIFGFSIGVLFLCHRFNIPSIIGFLLTGVVTGPQGLGLVSAVEQVDTLAMVGLILLLFTIGMEFAPARILGMWHSFFVGGGIQVGLAILGAFFVVWSIGRPLNEAIFLGFILSLSSTAIVLKLIQDEGEARTAYGKLAVAILIFQDIAAVPMMLIIPFLAGHGGFEWKDLIWALIRGGIIVGAAVLVSLRVIPPLFESVARTKSRELFLLTLLAVCFSVTWLSATAGISVSLGAFLAGVILSESDYRHQALGNILPFRDIFTNFFFISIGMLLNLDFFLDHYLLILSLTGAAILMKALAAGIASLAVGGGLPTALRVGLALCQVGEFGFVIAMAGRSEGIGEPYLYQLFLSVSLISMLVTPLLMSLSPYLAKWIARFFVEKEWEAEEEAGLEGHLIIVGYGDVGRHLASACKEKKIPYTILESNPDIVREEKRKGTPIFFGEASNWSVLENLQVKKADSLAILINDSGEEKRIVEVCKKLNPHLWILARTRSLGDDNPLIGIGADEVVVDNQEIANIFVERVTDRFMD